MTEPATSRTNNPQLEFLRHALAALAYRGGKALRNAPTGFADFNAGGGTRTPVQILAHVGDLLDWALSIARGKQAWHNAKPLPWEKETERFFAALQKFDDFLASGEVVQAPVERLLQGPIADVLTHVGQIAMLRRMAGGPVKGEDYYNADIKTGRVGPDQANPKYEF
jgi:hypothetical protein